MNFKEEIYEIAFGDNAINRDFDELEVIERIQSEIENDDGIFHLGRRPKRRKGYQPDLYFYWHGDIEEDYTMPNNYECLCEICFDINNAEGKIKWKEDRNPFECTSL